jgi:hypothetical protein
MFKNQKMVHHAYAHHDDDKTIYNIEIRVELFNGGKEKIFAEPNGNV